MSLLIPEEIEAYYAEAVEMYRKLHKIPEIMYDLPLTSSFVATYLKDLGLEVHENIGQSGVVAYLHNPGPCILLRADMDALPIMEESDHDYKSTFAGRMHACGHDGHITMLLIAAKIIKQIPNLHGSIKFVFQPAEEGGHGALAMRNEGVLEGVSEVYGIHLASPMNLGDYIFNDLYMSVNSDRFNVKVIGKGGHGSAPHHTIDPIPVAAQLILAFNGLATRRKGSVRVETNIVSTNKTFNAIPTEVQLEGSTRCVNNDDRDNVEKKMKQICQGIEIMHGVKIEFRFEKIYAAVKNHPLPSKYALQALQKVTLGNRIQTEVMIGEDFSYFTDEKPGAFVLIGATDLVSPSLHSNKFKINERALLFGISYWVNLVKERLGEPSS